MEVYKFILIIIGLLGTFYFGLLLFIDADKKDRKSLVITIAVVSISSFVLAFGLYFTIEILNNADTEKVDYSKVGPYGDLIGGILNPVVAFIGVMAAFLAFYVQYRANKQVQEQFDLQKFESQFYEMLRMHRENLSEMKIEGYEFETDFSGIKKNKIKKITTGKKIFVTLNVELKVIYTVLNKTFYSYYKCNSEDLTDKILLFKQAYSVFFGGVTLYERKIEKISEEHSLLEENLLKDFVKELRRLRKKHEKKGKKEIKNYLRSNIKIDSMASKTLWMSFNYRPFSGHQSLLAHYYRLLFQTVKFVVKKKEEFITYEEKRDYLRMLRSMLSNQEQLLLYYNWLAGHGDAWEIKCCNLNEKYTRNNIGYKFFTDYRMIHNIPVEEVIEDFNLEKIFNEEYRDFRYEENRKKEDTLFELIGITSNCR